MSYDILEGQFAQILNTSHGHWLIISIETPSCAGVYTAPFRSGWPRHKINIASLKLRKYKYISIMDIQLQVAIIIR